ncbi:peptidase S8/S53 domain-containing protein [Chytriomyces cf. hyalinus JEL632]|nr:peptidase S8/S53 domain-containing protein [Chytriomyces cf. hyalinus JEL632]
MQLTGLLSSLLLASQTFALVRRGAPVDAPNALTCAFLIDFEQGVDGHALLNQHLAGKGIQWTERTSINNKYANFVSVQLVGDCQDADTIFAGLPRASSFSVVTSRPAPQPVVASGDAGHPISDEAYHSITGVNDARNKLGLTGKGITVAIIDSGIYYLHPALGGGIGKGFKVLGGYDLVGDDYSAANPVPVPDDDPIDNCSGNSHGTHVAGIVAADARNIVEGGFEPAVPFTGVAYEANLLAFRVFGCPADNTGTDIVTAAIYRAADAGADIINLSLGGGPDYSDEPDTIAASIVGKYGHIVIASAGNSGAKGLQVTGNPSNAQGGLSVASFDNTVTPLPYSTIDDQSYFYGLGQNNASFVDGQVLDIVVNDLTADDTDLQTDGATNLNPAAKGKALLLRWGSTTQGGSSKRCGYALAAGAAQCILYGNTDELVGIAGNKGLPSMFLSRAGGLALIAKIKAGGKPNFVFTTKQKPYPIPTAGTISSFSSPGLSLDLEIKPDFGGLGGQVYSTVSVHAAQVENYAVPYGSYSGTSMASPYSAGVTALLLQQRQARGIKFEEVRGYLQNTASPRNIYQSKSFNSVAYQGAGLVNAFFAASTKSLVLPSAIALNDTENFKPSTVLTIQNNDVEPVTYELSYLNAATVNGYLAGDDFTQDATTTTFTEDQHAQLSFSVNSLTIAAGASAQVTVQFTEETALTPLPIYSGYIYISASNQADYPIHVPYAGVLGSYKSKAIWSRESASLAERWGKPTGLPSVSTGLFADMDFNTLTEGAVINATTGAGLLAVASSTTRGAFIEIIAQGVSKRSSSLEAAGFNTSAPIYIQLTDLITEGNPVTAALFVPMQRHSYAGAAPAAPPNVWGFFGKAYNASGYAAALPQGEYKVKFTAVKNFCILDSKNENDFDVILSPKFKLSTGEVEPSSSASTASSVATTATASSASSVATTAGSSASTGTVVGSSASTGTVVATGSAATASAATGSAATVSSVVSDPSGSASVAPSASASVAPSASASVAPTYVPVIIASPTYAAPPAPATPKPTNLYKSSAVSTVASAFAAFAGLALML